MLASEKPSKRLIEQAAHWLALLDDEPVSDRDRHAYEQWRAAHPLHCQTVDRMAGLGRTFEGLDAPQRHAMRHVTGSRASARRRRMAGGLASLLLVVGVGALASRSERIRALWPDHRTNTGEQRSLALADGSRIVADTDTRLNGFSGGERRLTLLGGQIMATVARDPARPFVVETSDGTATALGTVYSVRRETDRTIVTVIESAVRLCPADGACRTLHGGERADMTAGAVGPVERVDPELAALWATGWIEVHDRALTEVLGELARYSSRPIRYDAKRLGDVRVTGSYKLTDVEGALRSIASATGLHLHADNGSFILRR